MNLQEMKKEREVLREELFKGNGLTLLKMERLRSLRVLIDRCIFNL